MKFPLLLAGFAMLVAAECGKTALAATHTPQNGAQLSTALQNCVPGDIIEIDPALTYQGTFTLYNKGPNTNWITIQSKNLASLPPAGQRVGPAHVANLGKITGPANSDLPAFMTQASANHYKLIGLEIIMGRLTLDTGEMIRLGDGGSGQNSVAIVPHSFIIDRCYIHGLVGRDIKRGISLNAGYTEITNSTISEIHHTTYQTAGIGGWNGTGPYKFINNHIAASGENIILGGAQSFLTDVVPADIEVRRNHLYKDPNWRDDEDGGTNPSGWLKICNHFELKHGKRVTIEGNVLENNWAGEHDGNSLVLKLGNWGSTPWNVTEDVVFRNNIVKRVGGGVLLQGRDYASGSPQGLVRRLSIINNIFEDVNNNRDANNPVNGNFVSVSDGPVDVTIDHNTAMQTNRVISASSSYVANGFKFRNNLMPHNANTIGGVNKSTSLSDLGNVTLTTYFNDATSLFHKNVMMGGTASYYSSFTGLWSPATLAFPASWTGVLTNQATPGAVYAGWRVVDASSYDNTGTDSTDIGCNVADVQAATIGAVNGLPTLVGYDGFNYAVAGGLNTKAGGIDWGTSAWAQTATNPALGINSLTYTDTSGNALLTGGNKLQTVGNSRAYRNFPAALPTAGKTYWVSFRIKQTGGSFPSNHAGFSLFTGPAAGGDEIFIGKPGSQNNWGIFHSASNSTAVKSGTANMDVFLVCKLVFTGSVVNISLWVNPILNEASLNATPDAQLLNKAHTAALASLRFSTGTNSTGYQFDEFRMGTAFTDIAPKQ